MGSLAADALVPDAEPSGKPNGGRLGGWESWVFWLAALGIAVASTAIIVNLLEHADTRRRTQIVLAEIHVQASTLRLAEVRAQASPESLPELRKTARWASEAVPETLDRLLALDPDGDAADRVREAVDQYRKNVREHLRLLASGTESAARTWERKRSGPSFELLQEATTQSGIFYSAQATRDLGRVRKSAAVAIGSEALLIGLLVTLSSRRRHAARDRLLDERARHAARFEALVHNSADVIAVLNAEGVVQYTSSSVTRVLGYRPEEVAGTSCLEFIRPGEREQVESALREVQENPDSVLHLEVPAQHADGSLRWIQVSARNLLDDPNVGGIVLNYRDVTDNRKLRDELRHRALHDPLTGIPNRDLFGHQLKKALARARRDGDDGAPVSLLYIDLDGFKRINDDLGHEAGDELLKELARRLQRILREGDTLARLGGDEFAILLDRTDRDEAVSVAERVLQAIEAPCELTAGRVSVGASIGVAVGAAEPCDAEVLLRQADEAMYRVKANGKGGCAVYEPETSILTTRRFATAENLERALNRDELVLQYQPLFELGDHEIVGVEALVRWRTPDGDRTLPPADFLPIAEETGLIQPLGRWVLREACRQMHWWQIEYPSHPPRFLSINLSERQLADPHLPDDVNAALTESGLAPWSLALEVPEHVVLRDVERARFVLERLRHVGALLAIDDFGLSSLGHLPSLAVDMVKLERGFIDHLALRGDGPKLALRVLEETRRLSLRVVAQSVETELQVAEAEAAGCDYAQGFHLSDPLDPLDFEHLLDPHPGVPELRWSAAGSASA